MNKEIAMLVLAGICLLVILIGYLRNKAAVVLNTIVRMVIGISSICALNALFANIGISVSVGVNLISLLTTGALGISGVGLLYGIVFYSLL